MLAGGSYYAQRPLATSTAVAQARSRETSCGRSRCSYDETEEYPLELLRQAARARASPATTCPREYGGGGIDAPAATAAR